MTLLDALRRTPIWSPTAAKKFSIAEFQHNLVGTGPFKLSRMEAQRPLVFTRWDGYGGWNPVQTKKGPVDIDSLTIRFIGEASRARATSSRPAMPTSPSSCRQTVVDDYKDDKAYTFITKDQSGTGCRW